MSAILETANAGAVQSEATELSLLDQIVEQNRLATKSTENKRARDKNYKMV